MGTKAERALDRTLDAALKVNADFVAWLLGQTKFAELKARYLWSRSNNPWGTIAFPVTDSATGEPRITKRQSETDILAVFETEGGFRFALHIENKINSPFTLDQPEMYPVRAEQWKGLPRYQNYQDFETVLIAPLAFYERHRVKAEIFHRYVSHESIATFIPAFGAAVHESP